MLFNYAVYATVSCSPDILLSSVRQVSVLMWYLSNSGCCFYIVDSAQFEGVYETISWELLLSNCFHLAR